MGSAAKIRSKFENLRREIKADLKGSSMTCQRKDQSLAYCTIDAWSLAFYIIKASDCTNLRYYMSFVFHIFCIRGQFCNYFVSFSQQVLSFSD